MLNNLFFLSLKSNNLVEHRIVFAKYNEDKRWKIKNGGNSIELLIKQFS